MIKIRCETLQDHPAIAEVNTLAFCQYNEARLVDKIRQSNRYIPELSLVAEIEDVVVGHILFSYIDLVNEETLQVIGLAPLAVRPQFQRRGIGSALVEAGLKAADKKGEAIAVVLGHPDFYTRFGFQPSIVYGIESPFPVPEDFFMVKPFHNYQKKYIGKVVYPPAFDGV
ncbi:N-acetyltransferase [Aetokthonos hydrillicola Thurmond2011]|jgi:putative acetyltransferase|uniref:N-acetyltransferase n=1 Tax=Aetokthonos hydrillicola Thurmond2011 TaxID=2712845 RepID=A0AAP5IGV9_9CYAN|nr:N-acetyltransferase [Aetokthonos hydrillicola]MBO3461282.1 N-acetyltransferase [Aetokthonos hydrillicola CCALA 1050]MBW4589621.1 N-acetyltransferase [Aetokthonos hydrillicola CCALA 1050]MDR9899115.1 N-acetyltransferase [Aetokthonos hydrillicola Thurmond2011]